MDQSGPEPQPSEKAEQPLHGAEAIAQYIFGDRKARRRVYYLAECSKLPIYGFCATLYLRPSAYRLWIETQEARAVTPERDN